MNSTLKLRHLAPVLSKRNLNVGSGNVSNSMFSFGFTSNKRREYIKKEIIGYSMEQMYSVVSDVKNYVKFVPYVKKSYVHSHNSKNDNYKADLIVGFSPLLETYTSNVKLVEPSLVTADCNDGYLFQYLKNEWRFSPGLRDIPQSCVVDFIVLFEFKSLLHSNIANLFFEIICDQMENAFYAEVRKRYGEPSIRNVVLSSRRT